MQRYQFWYFSSLLNERLLVLKTRERLKLISMKFCSTNTLYRERDRDRNLLETCLHHGFFGVQPCRYSKLCLSPTFSIFQTLFVAKHLYIFSFKLILNTGSPRKHKTYRFLYLIICAPVNSLNLNKIH